MEGVRFRAEGYLVGGCVSLTCILRGPASVRVGAYGRAAVFDGRVLT